MSATTNGRPTAVARRSKARTSAAMPPYDDPDCEPGTARRDGYAAAVDEIVDLVLEKIHRHPHNRRPKEADILALAESLELHGQKEPIVVRPASISRPDVPVGHFELLSGETRVLAALRLGWEAIAARIRPGMSDAEALREVAVANAHRRDLDAIQRARMLQQLTLPSEEGGAGLAASAAGRIYGLESEGSVRNAVALLKLPECWQERVASGELAETAARQLVPFAGCDNLMRALDKSFRSTEHWHRERWKTREGVKGEIHRTVRELTRPVDAKQTHDYGYQLGHDHRRYFKLTPELEKQLQIVVLPLGKQGADERRALNHKLYDKLQLPLIRERLEAKKNAKPKAKGGKRPASPAEVKRKRAEQADQVQRRVREWRHRFLRLALSKALQTGSWKVHLLLPILCHTVGSGNVGWRGTPLDQFLEAAVVHNSCDPARERASYRPAAESCWLGRHSGSGWEMALFAHLEASNDPVDEIEHVLCGMARFLIWPQCEEAVAPCDAILSKDLPGMLPPIDYELVEQLAAKFGVDVKEAWRRGAIQRSHERPLVEEFFQLHYRWQLTELGRELLGEVPLQPDKKGAIADLMEHHSGKQLLKLPKSIEAAAEKPERRKGKR